MAEIPINEPIAAGVRRQHFREQQYPSWSSLSSWVLRIPSTKNVVLSSNNQAEMHSGKSFVLLPSISGHDDDEPDFMYLRFLLQSLILSTTLACCSAFDAKQQCRSSTSYDVYDQIQNTDTDDADIDEEDRTQQQTECRQMFRYVMIPVCFTVFSCSFLGVYVLRNYVRNTRGAKLERMQKYHAQYLTCVRLGIAAFLIVIAWAYGIIAIMLRPRSEDVQHNPYLALSAVDDFGHVGDNANLYYTSWISIGLSMGLMYHMCVEIARQRHFVVEVSRQASQHIGDVEAVLTSLTSYQLEFFRESRAMWYQSMYRLRIRTGVWTATLVATLVVVASSVHIWQEVLIPTAGFEFRSSSKFRDICDTLQGSDLPPTLCARTAFSLFSGLVALLLSFGAIVTHLLARRGAAQFSAMMQRHSSCGAENTVVSHHMSTSNTLFGGGERYIPLKTEFMVSILLSGILGMNAFFATGVHGPAAAVGNLYYASWISFLLCLRISLGCLEELCNIEQEDHQRDARDSSYSPPSVDGSELTSKASKTSTEDFLASSTDLMENDRAVRTRRYLLLGIASTVCSGSAFDAAIAEEGTLSMGQQYVMFAPSLVAVIAAIQFLLCLRSRTYKVVSSLFFGGVLSIVTFGICLGTLVITMHSDLTWAVNAIGEIKMANLYYFTWTSIVTAGLQMMSYTKQLLGLKPEDYVTGIWIIVCKVCFVILGAGFHIWHNISSTCTLYEIRSGAITFCSRTTLSIAVAFTGMIISGLVALFRIIFSLWCPLSIVRSRAHAEMVISVFFLLLFGTAVAVITGIGGPGQSVGDLYYATWISFLVAIGLVSACFEEIRRVELGEALHQPQPRAGEGGVYA